MKYRPFEGSHLPSLETSFYLLNNSSTYWVIVSHFINPKAVKHLQMFLQQIQQIQGRRVAVPATSQQPTVSSPTAFLVGWVNSAHGEDPRGQGREFFHNTLWERIIYFHLFHWILIFVSVLTLMKRHIIIYTLSRFAFYSVLPIFKIKDMY